ncbi:unnamed protein product [Hyaloperonospora brassicae]|uniref:RxLR effector candidate protein n=1 Tax=Hyaloperonospora brassicae TaxID=162125 RepID=A0AAV0V2D9_HYABA|nr:unnamed protein product [Hyaloperonospora brassicae]
MSSDSVRVRCILLLWRGAVSTRRRRWAKREAGAARTSALLLVLLLLRWLRLLGLVRASAALLGDGTNV